MSRGPAEGGTRHGRRLSTALLVVGFVLAAVHVRIYRNEQLARGQGSISAAARLRSWSHDVFRRDRSLDHAITLTFDIEQSEPIKLSFLREPHLISAPVAFDVLERPVPIAARVQGNETVLEFPAPPPAFGGIRQITLGFSTAAPPLTYGWGYRAAALPWAGAVAPPRVPTIVQAHVQETISAHGFRCSQESTGKICAIDAHRRRALAVPFEPVADQPFRIGFALALAVALSSVMFALYRRWEVLARRLGIGERPSRASQDVDPFDTAAFVARAIVAVLGLVAAVFLVGSFEGGFMPMIAPLALSLWALVAAAVVVLAVGLARPRAWAALGITIGLAALALHPALRFILPGLAALAATVTMQLTAPQR